MNACSLRVCRGSDGRPDGYTTIGSGGSGNALSTKTVSANQRRLQPTRDGNGAGAIGLCHLGPVPVAPDQTNLGIQMRSPASTPLISIGRCT